MSTVFWGRIACHEAALRAGRKTRRDGAAARAINRRGPSSATPGMPRRRSIRRRLDRTAGAPLRLIAGTHLQRRLHDSH